MHMTRILQREHPGFCRRTINKVKKWGAHLLVATSLATGSAGTSSCTEPTPQEQRDRITDTGIWAEPYTGDILQDDDGNLYMEKRFVLRIRNSANQTDVEDLIREVDGRITAHIPQINTYEVEIHGDVDDAISAVDGNVVVESAGRNYYFESAWDNDRYVEGDGILYDGTWWSRKIRLSEGLNIIENSGVELTPVTIAVIDVGFNSETSEIPYVDNSYHWDFADWDQDVFGSVDHGSWVASFAAANNNGERTNGVASTEESGIFSILPLKTESDDIYTYLLERFGTMIIGDDIRISAAVVYAAENAEELNIEAINISMGYPDPPDPFREEYSFYLAMADANQKGIVTVVAAGNDDRPINLHHPANVLGVLPIGGTALEGNEEVRFSRSNFQLLDGSICAPAQDVLVFDADGNPHLTSGTSFAAPQVAGLVALIRSINHDLNYLEISQLLRDNADDVILDDDPNPLVQGQIWKRINVDRTIQTLLREEGIVTSSQCSPVGISDELLSFSLDQRRIAFNGLNLNASIYDIENGTYNEISEACSDPVLNDGRLICIEGPDEGNRYRIVDLDNGSISNILYEPYVGDACAFEYSLYGNNFVFSANGHSSDERGKIYLANLDSGSISLIIEEGRSPSSYGNYVVYAETNTYDFCSGGNGPIRLYEIGTGISYELGGVGYAPRIYGNNIVYYTYERLDDDARYSLQLVNINDPTTPQTTEIFSRIEIDTGALNNGLTNYHIYEDHVVFMDVNNEEILSYDIPTGETSVVFEGSLETQLENYNLSGSAVQISERNIVFMVNGGFGNKELYVCEYL